MVALSVAINRTPNPSSHNRIADAPEEARWQISVAHRRLSTRDRTDVVARPRKPIPFRNDDPRPIAGQAEIAPNSLRHLNRQLIAGRGLGGQRHHVHLIDPILRTGYQYDRDGPVLYTFIPAFNVLVFPQVAVVEDFTRLRQR